LDLDHDNSNDEFLFYVDNEGYFKVPEVEMDEDSLAKFVNEQKFIKAEIGDDFDDVEVEDHQNGDPILEDYCKETFVPNLKDEEYKQDDVIKDFISNNFKRGELVKDVEWEPGFFLKTYPHLFICNN
jgi:hypothetical protein